MRYFTKQPFLPIFILLLYCLNITPMFALTNHTYYIHQDHLGSVVSVTDETGSPVSQNKYLPYGKVDATNTSIAGQVERGYTGQIKDAVTNLSYYNARYYDPTLSRFISADSVGGGNQYAYVGGNPIMSSDPSGNYLTPGDGGGGGGTTPKGRKRTKPGTPYTPTFNTPPLGVTQGSGSTLINPASDAWYSYEGSDVENYMGTSPSNPQALLLGLGAITGIGCGFGFIPACYATNTLLVGAFVQHIVTNGQDTSLTPVAMAAGSATLLEQAVIAGVQLAYQGYNYLKPPVQVPAQAAPAQPQPESYSRITHNPLHQIDTPEKLAQARMLTDPIRNPGVDSPGIQAYQMKMGDAQTRYLLWAQTGVSKKGPIGPLFVYDQLQGYPETKFITFFPNKPESALLRVPTTYRDTPFFIQPIEDLRMLPPPPPLP